MKNYNEFCESKKCPEFIKWNCGYGDCTSCKIIGQSENVTEYPDECLFLTDIRKFEQEDITT